jgi:hypothetical protein
MNAGLWSGRLACPVQRNNSRLTASRKRGHGPANARLQRHHFGWACPVGDDRATEHPLALCGGSRVGRRGNPRHQPKANGTNLEYRQCPFLEAPHLSGGCWLLVNLGPTRDVTRNRQEPPILICSTHSLNPSHPVSLVPRAPADPRSAHSRPCTRGIPPILKRAGGPKSNR